MPRTIQGNLEAKGNRFAIVISRFNSFISERLLAGALDALGRNGAQADDITIVRTVHTDQFNHAPAQLFFNRLPQDPGPDGPPAPKKTTIP